MKICLFAIVALLASTAANFASANSPNIKTTNYSVLPIDCDGAPVQMGTGTTGFLSVSLPASTVGFPEGCRIWIKNGDKWTGGRGKALVGFPSDFSNGQNILWPMQAGLIGVVNSAFVTLQRPGLEKLPSGTINLYTNFITGTDALGGTDGMTSGSPFKTLQYAMFVGCNEFELNGAPQTRLTYNMPANIADTQGIHYACAQIPGAQGGAAITISCGPNATINATNTDAFDVVVGATVSIVGCTLQATGTVDGSSRSADCMRADYGGRIFAINTTMVQCAGSDYAAENGGNIYLVSNDTDEGGSSTHFYATTGGVISTDYPTVTLTTTFGANVTKSKAWALAGQGGMISVPSWQCSGNSTCAIPGPFAVNAMKAITIGNGAIYTGAGTLACNNSYFPGTVNGTVPSPFCN